MTSDIDEIIKEQTRRLKKALGHLSYSRRKVQKMPTDPTKLDEEQLETWESFSARLARVVDLFLTKYLRSIVLRDDPGFDGTLRDCVNQAEKMRLIENADRWMSIRELRNITAHEYADEELAEYFKQARKAADHVLRIESLLGRKPKK